MPDGENGALLARIDERTETMQGDLRDVKSKVDTLTADMATVKDQHSRCPYLTGQAQTAWAGSSGFFRARNGGGSSSPKAAVTGFVMAGLKSQPIQTILILIGLIWIINFFGIDTVKVPDLQSLPQPATAPKTPGGSN